MVLVFNVRKNKEVLGMSLDLFLSDFHLESEVIGKTKEFTNIEFRIRAKSADEGIKREHLPVLSFNSLLEHNTGHFLHDGWDATQFYFSYIEHPLCPFCEEEHKTNNNNSDSYTCSNISKFLEPHTEEIIKRILVKDKFKLLLNGIEVNKTTEHSGSDKDE